MILTILIVLVLILALTIYFQPLFLIKWINKWTPDVLFFVNTDLNIIALTIDDGPHPEVTPQILDVLKEHSAQATFFLLGDHILGNEKILERMRREGHELGNHLVKDYPTILLPGDEFERQLLEVDKLIQPLGKKKWFRPGSGWYNKRIIRQLKVHDYRCALASIYPHDTIVRNVAIISAYILAKASPGAIIVIHDGASDRVRTVKVLRQILPLLKDQGYKIVTLSELVSKTELKHQ
jgi:peptidoglycan/xylan/chitin deacetylase (PgdA/CDA1 family)